MHVHVRRGGGYAKFWLEPLELGLSQLWWVKCILRYISQERGGGTNHKDTKDTKIDRSYCQLNLSHRT
ncbi:MAG: DUF4160 domain-containing protein [Microcystis aeruginosa DA14]|uniref:DUF4160 domain-containing protein n=1 Tax=Microcystis aeruginosa DA14 TaxID=1987506 RepID=A0A3E0M6J8_MICAE|nr:MAG: DUF4160 domain-containing protein [Microcystis aeruginosa DA14]